MSRDEAHEILDMAREGHELSRQTITLALLATGDLVIEHQPIEDAVPDVPRGAHRS